MAQWSKTECLSYQVATEFCDVTHITGSRGGAVGLRHCATSREVAVSIPVGVIGIFHWHNPYGRTMALRLTAFNRNEYQEYFIGDKGGRCVGLTSLPGILRACAGLLYLVTEEVANIGLSPGVNLQNTWYIYIPGLAGCGAAYYNRHQHHVHPRHKQTSSRWGAQCK